jgi:two-component system, LytTR family, response regulator
MGSSDVSDERIRVLLVDDEPLANAGLRTLLAAHPDIEVIGEARGGREAIGAIRSLNPNLVFLDVQMPVVNGFDVLREVGYETIPAVVFITAYDEFAVRAFDVRALDYLVKPVAADRLRAALRHAREVLARARDGALAEQVRDLVEQHLNPPPAAFASRLVIRVGRRQVLLTVSEVDWIEADDYCSIVHAHGARHVVRETLASLATRLDPSTFARVHRSAIVNMARVHELKRHRLGRVSLVMADGFEIPVSRARRAELAARLGDAR